MRFLVGAYTADMDGTASGIGAIDVPVRADEREGAGAPSGSEMTRLLAPCDSPSWIARHPSLPVVYATLEARGVVQAFRETDAGSGADALEPLGSPVPAGEAVCHVEVAPDGSRIVAACWGDGRLVSAPLDADGTPDADAATLLAASVDPYGAADAEARPSRSHTSRFLADGTLATTDLGHDVVRFWRGLDLVGVTALPEGSGPRHLVQSSGGLLFVVTEYSCETFALERVSEGEWIVAASTPLGAAEGDSAAEIALSADERFLSAGVRGSNTLATVRIERATGMDAGAAGAPPAAEGDEANAPATRLVLVDVSPAGVDWPRHHVVGDGFVAVAGQRSNDVVVHELDAGTGAPTRVVARVATPSPTRLLAWEA